MPIPSSRIVFAEPPSKDRTTITQRATALTPCNSDWGDLFAQRPLPAIVLLESKREVESKREADRRWLAVATLAGQRRLWSVEQVKRLRSAARISRFFIPERQPL